VPSAVPVANVTGYEDPIVVQSVAPLARVVPSKAVILILSAPVKLSETPLIEILLLNEFV
jgi:hypothetical protein